MAAQLKTFEKLVSVAGTAVQLSTVDNFVREVVVQALANTDNIFIGGSDVDSTNGLILTPLKSFTVSDMLTGRGEEEYINLKDIWIDAVVGGEGVRVMYIERSK
jgi:hypothetical protein